MFTLTFSRSLLVFLAASAFAAGGVAAPATAASSRPRTCETPGYTLTYRDKSNAILKRRVRGKDWEEGPYRFYACSHKYGRLVPLGLDGVSPDGPEWVDIYAFNSRYVAAGGGWAGNARAADNNFGITVTDLKTGSAVSSSSISKSTDAESWVSHASLNRAGDLAWINGDVQGAATSYSVNLLPASGARKRTVLATSSTIDPNFLSWVSGTDRVIWSDPVASLPFTPRISRQYSPLKRAKCTRRGDRIESRGYGYVVISRPFNKGGWQNGRVLIACSLKYKRRVVLAHSGTNKDGATFAYSWPTANEGFAGVVVKRDAGGIVYPAAVLEVNLGNGSLICAASAADGYANGLSVRHLVLDASGVMAWVAEGDLSYGGGHDKDLRVCDGGTPRLLLRHTLLVAGSVHFASDRPGEILYTIDPRIAD